MKGWRINYFFGDYYVKKEIVIVLIYSKLYFFDLHEINAIFYHLVKLVKCSVFGVRTGDTIDLIGSSFNHRKPLQSPESLVFRSYIFFLMSSG